MSRWWRAYDEALHDPKLIGLSDKLHRAWFSLLCVASKHGGALPPANVVAIELRISPHKAAEYVTALVAAGLIDKSETGFVPHNWSARQYRSDVTDPTNAERQKRFRNSKRNAVTTVTGKRPDTDTDTDKKEETAGAVTPSATAYAFESGVIRLNHKDFDRWKKSFSHLDHGAELLALTEWAGQQGQKWFFALSGALAKRNREVGIRLEQQKTAQPYRWNGMEGVT